MPNLIPEQLQAIARQIEAGVEPEPITVRMLLGWFGAERRGYFVVEKVRTALTLLELRTKPDFGTVWLDTPITFHRAAAGPVRRVPPGTPEVPQEPAHVEAGAAVGLYNVGQIEAANRGVVRVAPEDNITRAITIMMARDFSQLPIMAGERDVLGVVTWTSIGARQALGARCDRVLDCAEPHQEISASASLFSAIPIIAERQYVLVRDPKTGRITGIVTATDIAQQLQNVAEPLSLLRRIEQAFRALIDEKFTEPELAAARDPADTDRHVVSAGDLFVNELARLIEPEQRWRKLGVRVDRGVFMSEMKGILSIRNDVMHFDPDPLSAEELGTLRAFASFMEFLAAAETSRTGLGA